MKRSVYMAALFAVLSCSGIKDSADISQDMPDEFVAPYTLYADKTQVEASGADLVTFSLKDSYGREMLSDKNTLQSVNIVSAQGIRVPRMEISTGFISNGTFAFSATYKGEKSANVVEITARNRKDYEKFHKNVAIWKATATWCAPCAYMTQALEGLDDDAREHSVEVCWHYQDDLSIYVNGDTYDCGTRLVSVLGGSGVPTVGLDLIQTVMEKSSSVISNAIWSIRRDYPATCGIKLSTAYDNGEGTIDVQAELTSSTGGEYDLGCAVLLNDQIVPGGTNDGGRYTHIARAATGNYYFYSGNIASVGKDGTLSLSLADIETSGLEPDKLSVVCWAIVRNGDDGARIDNIVEVKLGESVDYRYNE